MPFVARWPGQIKAGSTNDATICHTHFLTTCLDVLGKQAPADAAEDSFSIWPLLQGKEPAQPVFPYVVHQAASGRLAIRQGKWKLVAGMSDGTNAGSTGEELYDLSADVGETKNIAAEHPDQIKTLLALLEKSIADGRSTSGPAQKNDINVPLRVAAPAATKKRAK